MIVKLSNYILVQKHKTMKCKHELFSVPVIALPHMEISFQHINPPR